MSDDRNRGSWLQRAMSPSRGEVSGAKIEQRDYEYQPAVAAISYEEGAALLESRGHRVVRCGVDSSHPYIVERVTSGLVQAGIPLEEFRIDAERFERFRQVADYPARYPQYYGARMAEKHLEHFVTLELLGLTAADVFIDIASEDSPVPDIFARMSAAQTYWQDIQYEPGISGRRIGGDACDLPVPDGFASAVALTCSLEHFERDADQRLCDELGRVIRPGGRLVIAPLYLFTEPAVQTDPIYSAQADVPFDEGVTIYAAKDWRNRHGRFYSTETLQTRVLSRLAGAFDCRVETITNWQAIPDHTYLRFALFCRRR